MVNKMGDESKTKEVFETDFVENEVASIGKKTEKLNFKDSAIDELQNITGLSVEDVMMARGKDIEFDDAEIKALQEALPELFKEQSPEFAKLIEEIQPQMDKLYINISRLRESGDYIGAAEKLMEFMEEQEKNISEKLQEGELKDQLLAYIGIGLDLSKLEKEANDQVSLQKWSVIYDCMPVYGAYKMYREAYSGVDYNGKKLNKSERKWKITEATAGFALDVAWVGGLLLGGGPSAALSASKVGVASKKTLDVGRVLTRLAAYVRKTGKFSKASKAIFKAGIILRRNPKLAQLIVKYGQSARIKKGAKLKDINKYQAKREQVYGQMKAYKYSEADRRNRQSGAEADINKAV
ncbi:hypothetical protein GF376_03420 [Candidatus Peregrinibacteria bacterium]|nr:hypothetical protein [Candidatus Peregrinibacteria bacterium]